MHYSSICALLAAYGAYAAPTISAYARFIESLGPPGQASEPGTFGSPYSLASGAGSKRECLDIVDGFCADTLPVATPGPVIARFIESGGPPAGGPNGAIFGSPYAMASEPEKRIMCPLVDGTSSCGGPILLPVETPLAARNTMDSDPEKRIVCPLVDGISSCGGPILLPVETPLAARDTLSMEDRLNLAYDPNFQPKRHQAPAQPQITRRASLAERRVQEASYARPLEGFTGPRTVAHENKRMEPIEIVGPIPEKRSSTVELPIVLDGGQVGQVKVNSVNLPGLTGTVGSAEVAATFAPAKRRGLDHRAPWRAEATRMPAARN